MLDERLKGKLAILLAIGLSQREAAHWLGCGKSTVWRAFASDRQLRSDLQTDQRLARLHPLTRIYRAAGESWKAATWLLTYQDKRGASTANPEDEANEMTRLVEQIQERLLKEEEERAYDPVTGCQIVPDYPEPKGAKT